MQPRWERHWVQVPLQKYADARETFAMMVSAPKAKLIEVNIGCQIRRILTFITTYRKVG